MTTRLAAVVRTCALLLPAMAVSGAAPAAAKRSYAFHCRLMRIDGTQLASPTLTGVERQPCTFTAGGTTPTLRRGVTLDYGTSLAAWAAPSADGTLLLDLTVCTTTLDFSVTDGVTVAGATAHTVRTIRPGQPTHVAVGSVGLTLDLTVDDCTR